MTPTHALILLALTMAYISGQWTRYSLNYLAAVSVPGCETECAGGEIPLCDARREGASQACFACYYPSSSSSSSESSNRSHGKDASHYNLKQATCMTEGEYAGLVSYGFIALFAISGLAAGRVADRFNRRNIVVVAAIGWSLATVLQSLSLNFGELLLARVLMGFFTAYSAPASYSILADVFPLEERAFANGIYSLGVYVGGALSSLTILMARKEGWRFGSFFVAGFGVLSALGVLVIVPEPLRGSQRAPTVYPRRANEENEEEEEASPAPPLVGGNTTLFAALRSIARNRILRTVFLAASLRFFGGFALGAYLPQFYKRRFPAQNGEYAVLNAFVVSLAGGASAVLGGRLADRLSQRRPRARAEVPGVGALLALLPLYASLTVSNFYASISFLFCSYFLAECWFGSALSLIQTNVDDHSRALAVAIYLFFGSMLGNISPLLVPVLDHAKTADSLSRVILGLACFSYVSCSVVFFYVGYLVERGAREGMEDDQHVRLLAARQGSSDDVRVGVAEDEQIFLNPPSSSLAEREDGSSS